MAMDFWIGVTQLGNASLLLPTALALLLWLLCAGQRRLAWHWALCFGAAVLLVLASKLAFLGWGIGSAAMDFTGISGHSTVSTAVLAMGAWLAAAQHRRWRALAFAAGLGLGALVSVSRVLLQAHSLSEVVAGFLLGLLAAGLPVLAHGTAAVRLRPRWLPLALGAALLLAPQLGRPAEVHGLVVKMALMASGRAEVFQREGLR